MRDTLNYVFALALVVNAFSFLHGGAKRWGAEYISIINILVLISVFSGLTYIAAKIYLISPAVSPEGHFVAGVSLLFCLLGVIALHDIQKSIKK